MKNPEFPVSVFYDGACVVCSTEIEHYLRKDREGKLIAVNISSPDFDPEPYHISHADFMHELHVIDRNGFVYRGVEAFRAIWQAFPTSTIYGLLGVIVTAPVMSQMAQLLYKGFAHIRKYLPQRHDCIDGTCSIRKKH